MNLENKIQGLSKQYTAMGWIITGVVVIGGVLLAYNKYIQNKTLTQQSKINKFVIADWQNKFTDEEIAEIQSKNDLVEKFVNKIS